MIVQTRKAVELHIGKCQIRAPHSSTELPCVSTAERMASKIAAEKTAHGHIQEITY